MTCERCDDGASWNTATGVPLCDDHFDEYLQERGAHR